jgi:predicted membrane protein
MPLLYVILALIVVAVAFRVTNMYAVAGTFKTLINVVLTLVVVGMALWLINTYIPMAGSIKAILNIVVVAATCVGVLQAVGLWSQVVRLWHNFVDSRVPH